jgi:deoxycytidylate deaminase
MKIGRLPWDDYWMLMAHLTATRSTCDRGPELLFDPGRHGVGAVLVKNRRMIAGGYNGSAPGQPHCSDPEEFYACARCGKWLDPRDVHDIVGRGLLSTCDCGRKEHWASRCGRGAPEVGVKKSKGGHIMRDGHCVRTIHSEANALMQCALDGVSPQGSTLYCTASPCYDCAKLVIRAGIEKVFFGESYASRYGLSEGVQELFKGAGIRFEGLMITADMLE